MPSSVQPSFDIGTENKRRVPSPILTGYFNFRLDSSNTDNQFVPNNKAFSIPNDLRMQPYEIFRMVENCVPIQGVVLIQIDTGPYPFR